MATKTILITGATSGIGRDAAIHLAKRGHRVIACGRNERALEELRTEGIDARSLDVTSRESIEALRDDVLREHGAIDVLVNNAGYGLLGPLEMLSESDVRAQFETNVFGLLAMTRAFLPTMREKAMRDGGARIINVSSVGGRVVFPFGGAYHATKYAVEAMSDALRMEVAQFGIGVVLIEPGYIRTGFTGTSVALLEKYREEGDSPYALALAQADGVEAKLDRFAAPPRAVSKAITRAVESRSPRARYVAPWINAFGPWLWQLVPTRLIDWALRRATGLVPASGRRALPSGA